MMSTFSSSMKTKSSFSLFLNHIDFIIKEKQNYRKSDTEEGPNKLDCPATFSSQSSPVVLIISCCLAPTKGRNPLQA